MILRNIYRVIPPVPPDSVKAERKPPVGPSAPKVDSKQLKSE